MLILIYYQNKKEFMVYKSPIADFKYNLDMLGYNSFAESIDQFKDFDTETVISVVEQVAKFNEQEMVDSNKKADREGIVYIKDGKEGPEVKTPDYFKPLYQSVIESGYIGASNPTEYGGGGAPFAMGILNGEIGIASNMAFYMGPGLSQGAIKAILKKGNKELKDKYLPKMISGEWMGTMCLTEPQCGTDLGLIRSTATLEEDYYKLNGQKIWISFGEHDLTENIIHLVLARLPDAPEGIKGISLFLVPKRLDDNSRNPIFCGGLEHKLGIISSPTCVMNMDDARGWMIGEPNKGMEAMFLMMKWAFDNGYRRYEWKCNALNLRSRSAAQRLGFSYEGVFRQMAIVKGRNRDTAWFAMIDKEWKGLECCFKEFLSDDNFDHNGKPKKSLRALTKPLLYKVDNLDST